MIRHLGASALLGAGLVVGGCASDSAVERAPATPSAATRGEGEVARQGASGEARAQESEDEAILERAAGEVAAERGNLDVADAEQVEAVERMPAPEAPPEQETFAFECEGGETFVAQFSDEAASVMLREGLQVLPRLSDGTGEFYDNGETRITLSGQNAIVVLDTGEQLRCQNDPEQAVWEDARLRGVNFRAVGVEPGFVLEIDDDNIVVLTDYGANRYVFAKGDAAEAPEGVWKRYRASSGSTDFEATLRPATCETESTDEAFGTQVTVDLSDEKYEACGRNLE